MARSIGIKDVAWIAGVSIGTVSNVLNRPELVSPAALLRVRTVISNTGYIRSESARHLRTGQSRELALLVLDVGNPFFTEVARGAEQVAMEHGLAVVLCHSARRGDQEHFYLAHFAQRQVLGVLLSPVSGAQSDISALRSHGVPVVMVDRGAELDEVCSVSVDDMLGGRLAVRHLLDAGHRRIAFVGGPLTLKQVHNRLEGARQAVAAAGLPPPRARTTVASSVRSPVPAARPGSGSP